MDSRTEKKIDRELDRADKHHDKATIAEAKGHTGSAERHEHKALNHEHKADTLAHKVGVPAGGAVPYSGLNFPLSNSTAHPTYGYQRLPRDKKAERFEAKAVEWERRGNTLKAQKNREKALRHRQRMQPGYTPIAHQQPYYVDKANRFDQRALRYQQLGMAPQAQRYQQRALRTRNKHGITGALAGGALAGGATTGLSNLGTATNYNNTGAYVGPITPMGTVYKGLNHPLTGATQHPTFGYSKLTSAQKGQRYDAKAAEWEKRGDMLKAQKNREKANRYRQMGQAGYVKPTRAQTYYVDRASHFDQKAIRAQQMGRNQQALRAQQRAQRIRTKHNIPSTGMRGMPAAAGLAGAGLAPSMGKYQGLNFPYTSASNHPTYGYQRLGRDQKAQRFDLKAAEWEKRGNLQKAQKNREKANRYRQMSQPGYVRPTRPQNYYSDRANLFDHKAAQYQQWGMAPQAQRYRGRSQRIRTKHNIAPLAGAGLGATHLPGSTWTTGTTQVSPLTNVGTVYSGLNFPYSGASAHPSYGYQRLPHNKKAERFEAKALEWERRGNLKKAQKNREKALRYRARSQPGYVKPVRPQNYYIDRANLYDQRALQYQQWGMIPQAQRYQGRSKRVRSKHNLPLYTAGAATGATMAPATYQGLNFPYNNTVAHPTYGYQRLPRNHKADRFEAKALEWERRGNMKKATKNREKALRIRQKLAPGYVAPVRPQTYYVDRANTFDQKALQYQQWGMAPQANRYQQRATRVRGKYNLPASTVGAYPTTTTARVL